MTSYHTEQSSPTWEASIRSVSPSTPSPAWAVCNIVISQSETYVCSLCYEKSNCTWNTQTQTLRFITFFLDCAFIFAFFSCRASSYSGLSSSCSTHIRMLKTGTNNLKSHCICFGYSQLYSMESTGTTAQNEPKATNSQNTAAVSSFWQLLHDICSQWWKVRKNYT